MDAQADFREAEFVKIINRIFHEEEATVYDASHPEIFEFEPATWHELARFLPSGKKGLRLLDVGTGTGFVPETLSAHLGKEDTVVLMDLSKTMLELARSKLLPKKVPRFLFVVADAERLPIAGEQFDVVNGKFAFAPLSQHQRLPG